MESEQRAARDREILAARLATPARRTVRPATGIDDGTTAVWAIGVPFVVCPAEPNEDPLCFLVAHARDSR